MLAAAAASLSSALFTFFFFQMRSGLYDSENGVRWPSKYHWSIISASWQQASGSPLREKRTEPQAEKGDEAALGILAAQFQDRRRVIDAADGKLASGGFSHVEFALPAEEVDKLKTRWRADSGGVIPDHESAGHGQEASASRSRATADVGPVVKPKTALPLSFVGLGLNSDNNARRVFASESASAWVQQLAHSLAQPRRRRMPGAEARSSAAASPCWSAAESSPASARKGPAPRHVSETIIRPETAAAFPKLEKPPTRSRKDISASLNPVLRSAASMIEEGGLGRQLARSDSVNASARNLTDLGQINGKGTAQRNDEVGMKSRYNGVCWMSDRVKWRAQITRNRTTVSLGCFTEDSDAAAAFDKAALLLDGRDAELNFPITKYLGDDGKVVDCDAVKKLLEKKG